MAPPPQIPPELVADLIELTVELLIEEERNLEAHAPLSNRFLRSAALVDRTWHAIATPVLLKSGIVTSASVPGFLSQIRAHGMEDTLESVRFGEASGGVPAQGAADEDTAFDLLVESLSGLNMIEFVESGAHFQTPLPLGRFIQTVHLSNNKLLAGGFGRKFEHCPPAHLVVTETRELPELDRSADTTTPLLRSIKVFRSAQSVNITMCQSSGTIYFGMLMMIGVLDQSLLRTCRLEVTTVESFREALATTRPGADHRLIYSYPHLHRLTTHLLLAYFLLNRGTHPSLTSLEILDDPTGVYVVENPPELLEPLVLELLANLPVLANLKTPACWASDAVREWCERKGVKVLAF